MKRAEAGYNLVVLAVAITILNVLLAAALPLWSTQIRREKEEEAIFRGLQYAEAIRVFRNRFNRLPNRLEELIETEPRSIRQLWKDPLTEDGKWLLIFEGQQRQGLPTDPNGRGPRLQARPGGEGDVGDFAGDPQDPQEGKDVVAVGPIIGVRSRSKEESILVFDGKRRHNEWQFTVNMILQSMGQQARAGGAGVPLPGRGPTPTRWIGRPWPAFVQAPPSGELPLPDAAGGAGGKGRRPRPPAGTSRQPRTPEFQ